MTAAVRWWVEAIINILHTAYSLRPECFFSVFILSLLIKNVKRNCSSCWAEYIFYGVVWLEAYYSWHKEMAERPHIHHKVRQSELRRQPGMIAADHQMPFLFGLANRGKSALCSDLQCKMMMRLKISLNQQPIGETRARVMLGWSALITLEKPTSWTIATPQCLSLLERKSLLLISQNDRPLCRNTISLSLSAIWFVCK